MYKGTPVTRCQIERYVSSHKGKAMKDVPFGAHACRWLLKELDEAKDIARLFDTVPPHSPHAEAAMVGSMILDDGVIAAVLDIVSEEDLFYEKNRLVFHSVCKLFNASHPVDLVLLKEHMNFAGTLKRVGGIEYLVDLASSVPSSATARYYAEIVAEKSRRRLQIEGGLKQINEAYNGNKEETE